jgi:hypothetical protein
MIYYIAVGYLFNVSYCRFDVPFVTLYSDEWVVAVITVSLFDEDATGISFDSFAFFDLGGSLHILTQAFLNY